MVPAAARFSSHALFASAVHARNLKKPKKPKKKPTNSVRMPERNAVRRIGNHGSSGGHMRSGRTPAGIESSHQNASATDHIKRSTRGTRRKKAFVLRVLRFCVDRHTSSTSTP